MGKIDKIKEQIGWLKVVFGILTATLISLVGFLVTSYSKNLEPLLIILTTMLILIILLAIIIVNKKAFQKMDELEELE
jgi:hypothetical protein